MSSLTSQLKAIRPHVPRTPRAQSNSPMEPTRSPMQWVADGEDHINMSSKSCVELGRFLTMNSTLNLNHAHFGKFASADAFRHYISSVERDDALRSMTGPRLFQFAKGLTQARVVNLRAIVMDANWQRINQHPALRTAFKDSTLPLDCYRVEKDSLLRIRTSFAKWFIWGMEEIRTALKENREPNFSLLLDRPGSGIYDFAFELPGGKLGSKEDVKAAHNKPKEAPKQPKQKQKQSKQKNTSLTGTPAVTNEASAPQVKTARHIPAGSDLSNCIERAVSVDRDAEGKIVTTVANQIVTGLVAGASVTTTDVAEPAETFRHDDIPEPIVPEVEVIGSAFTKPAVAE